MASALVTGVSRRSGIAWTVAHRLAADGWDVTASGWPEHDRDQPWGEDPQAAPTMPWVAADLAEPDAPARLVEGHVRRAGGVDAFVAVHARATVLLVQAAAAAGVRRVVLFTTGVHQGPMPTEIPYVVSKAAIQGVTATLASALAPSGATVNCVNPGPNDTGWPDTATTAAIARAMPLAPRWGAPADVTELVAFLVSDA